MSDSVTDRFCALPEPSPERRSNENMEKRKKERDTGRRGGGERVDVWVPPNTSCGETRTAVADLVPQWRA